MLRRTFLGKTVAVVSATAVGWRSIMASPLSGRSERADRSFSRQYSAQRRFAQVRFGRVAYIDRGNGPACLFLHGFPLSSFQWRGAIERLSPFRRCIAPDFLALGNTEVAEGQDVGPSAQAKMIIAFLDHLSIHEVDVIANDSGGAVAQLIVASHPDRVRSLLLTNCDVETDSPPPALKPVIEMARAGTFPDQWLVPWLANKELARSATGLGGLCYCDPAHPTDAAIEQYLGPLVSSPARKALTNAYALGLEVNPLAGIEAILRHRRVPTRIVWGMADTIFSHESPAYLAGVLPGTVGVTRIPEAKLFFPEEYPDRIAAEARMLWAAGGRGRSL